MQGTPISLPLPLADFAKAYDGPPTDPKVFEEQQRKLQEELQKKAEEARKKLEASSRRRTAPRLRAAKEIARRSPRCINEKARLRPRLFVCARSLSPRSVHAALLRGR